MADERILKVREHQIIGEDNEQVTVWKESGADITLMTTGETVQKAIEDIRAGTREPVHGIPAGGTQAQSLVKLNDNDYEVTWHTVEGGGGSNPPVGGWPIDSLSLDAQLALGKASELPLPTTDDTGKVLTVTDVGTLKYETSSAEDMRTVASISNYTYNGTDLRTKFADEINVSYGGNVASWIQNRIRSGNYDGLYIGDFISFDTTDGQHIRLQIAGIDTYTGYGNTGQETGHHIDFISMDCLYNNTTSWNMTKYNNGLSNEHAQFLTSNLYAYINSLAIRVPDGTGSNPPSMPVDYTNSGIYSILPTELKNVIIPKHMMTPIRYTSGILLSDDVGYSWRDMRVWLPYEQEILGGAAFSSRNGYSDTFIQYPLFIGNSKARAKYNGYGDPDKVTYWLASVVGGNSMEAVCMTSQGYVAKMESDSAYWMPICVRIG